MSTGLKPKRRDAAQERHRVLDVVEDFHGDDEVDWLGRLPDHEVRYEVASRRIKRAGFRDHAGGTIHADRRPASRPMAQPPHDPAIAAPGIDGGKGAIAIERPVCGRQHLIYRRRVTDLHADVAVGRSPFSEHFGSPTLTRPRRK